ncbi:HEPN domain-containing protein [Chitinophaga oryziterrae]|uniref:HEPN domain-containing protein n=1 Tax=Chitinophaga oryziterrae TaxID=1031224 RepID=A0A6N8JIQ6_9BACT|nr:HEPN domain-containing protein [Chitinophaga oryziterrae]MVT45143.1 HEPN domain-containing protein [Chitinophaga oryziterrae]
MCVRNAEGQYFFTDIEKEGILLYDSGNVALAERKPLSAAEAKVIAQKYYDQWYRSAQEFYIDAQNVLNRGSLKNAVFYLYQAAERAYNAVVLV